MIRYCDGSSFTGNSKKIYNGTKLYFKGARIFESTLKVLLKKGMKSAKNALLVGESAGGVAAMLHCDSFRQKFSNSTHVKCLSDAGYFFAAKKHNFWSKSLFVSIFEGVVNLHRPTKMLPKSCTSKFTPTMCYFAQNVQHDIKTPIFFIMSEFDSVEIAFTTDKSYDDCMKYKTCTSDQINVMQG
ncbi:PREDICTED: pectin acetylesterase 7-like [Ipomoea nil]|uniref:pectin acetylesterase 7-like n=1 Tax=Ipomoea nil TaxID=35883 RepID=UPI0009012FF6|nr:PREDICTED: pectin acetylesterase 7-like [Ipomoea nil]